MNVDLVCERCGTVVRRARQAQRFCSTNCRVVAHQKRVRATGDGIESVKRSAPVPSCPSTPVYASPLSTPASTAHGPNPDGSTPGALQGDDYPLTYDENGNVELPECLRRAPADDEVILVTVPPEANEAA